MSDWIKKLLSWDFHEIGFKGYPNWDKLNGETYFVMQEKIHNKDKSSHDLDVIFDDIAKGQFYSRDWTKSGMPFINDEEIYWSGFWFQYYEDAQKFVDLYDGVGNWMPNYKEFNEKCNSKRNS